MFPSVLSTTAASSYSHPVLFAELPDSELVHAGGQVLHRLVQVLGVTLHQRLRDPAAAVLQKTQEEGSAAAAVPPPRRRADMCTSFKEENAPQEYGERYKWLPRPSKNVSVFVETPGARADVQRRAWFSLAGLNFGEFEAGKWS